MVVVPETHKSDCMINKLKLKLSALLIFRMSLLNVLSLSAFFKSFNLEKSTQDEKVSFIKRNELKAIQGELLLFFIFKSVYK